MPAGKRRCHQGRCYRDVCISPNPDWRARTCLCKYEEYRSVLRFVSLVTVNSKLDSSSSSQPCGNSGRLRSRAMGQRCGRPCVAGRPKQNSLRQEAGVRSRRVGQWGWIKGFHRPGSAVKMSLQTYAAKASGCTVHRPRVNFPLPDLLECQNADIVPLCLCTHTPLCDGCCCWCCLLACQDDVTAEAGNGTWRSMHCQYPRIYELSAHTISSPQQRKTVFSWCSPQDNLKDLVPNHRPIRVQVTWLRCGGNVSPPDWSECVYCNSNSWWRTSFEDRCPEHKVLITSKPDDFVWLFTRVSAPQKHLRQNSAHFA